MDALLYHAGYLPAFFIKIEPFPYTNGRQDGVLGMKPAENFKVVCGLAAVDGYLGVVSLYLPVFFIAYF